MTPQIPAHVETLYFVLEYTGVFLAALVGGTVAKRMNLDIVGFYVIALVSALAGSFIRDAMLSDGPAAALQSPGYMAAATTGALVAYVVDFKAQKWATFRFYMDVVTIGVWAVVGVTRAVSNDLPWISCIVIGVVTATGGSFARDVILGKIPSLFTSQKMYVFPAVLASAVMLGFHHAGRDAVGMVAAAVAGSVLAMVVYWLGAFVPSKKVESREIDAIRNEFAERRGADLDDDALADAITSSSDAEFVGVLRALYLGKAREGANADSAAA
ncbi:TRIC cation channel family protein [Corynebacterium qintianiae]|uniref:TRIC cation channel family protein n=1 Tax=Corynebacterium qintianiae TaxID=2709392 RepID=UPI0013ED637D|nr:TRIC cation channel family protein [Corynebacterium qintianiae]